MKKRLMWCLLLPMICMAGDVSRPVEEAPIDPEEQLPRTATTKAEERQIKDQWDQMQDQHEKNRQKYLQNEQYLKLQIRQGNKAAQDGLAQLEKNMQESGKKLDRLKNQYSDVITSHVREQLSYPEIEPAVENPQKLTVGQRMQKTILKGVQNFLDMFGTRWQAVDHNLARLEILEEHGNLPEQAREDKQSFLNREKFLQANIHTGRQALARYRLAHETGQAEKKEITEELKELVRELVKQKEKAEKEKISNIPFENIDRQIDLTLHSMGFSTREIDDLLLQTEQQQ